MGKRQSKRNRGGSALLINMLVGAAFLLPLMGKASVPPAMAAAPKKPVAAAPQKQEATADQKKLAELLRTYFTYERENRPDPFTPFIQKQKPQLPNNQGAPPVEEEVLTGMQLFEPGQLSLVSIVFTDDNQAIAMVQDSIGQGYMIRKGTKIGRTGVVEEILSNVVVIKQWSLSFSGQKRYKDIEMVLRKEGD